MLSRLLTFLLLCPPLVAVAQFASPISFETSYEHVAGDEFNLIVTATAEAPAWSLYSQYTEDNGPIPTSFMWTEGDHYEIIGKGEEKGHLKDGFDELFGVDVKKFIMDEPAVFIQRVKIKDYGTPIETTIEYMCCDEEQCLPPTDEVFSWDVAPPAPDRGATTPPPPTTAEGDPPAPAVQNDPVASDVSEPASPVTPAPASSPEKSVITTAADLDLSVRFDPEPIGACSVGATETKGATLWSVFGLGFLGGLFALLMPCIFPMIPLTVSFFTKSEGTRAEGIRKASLYGFFIFLIYVLLSLPFHVVQGLEPSLLNNIASSVPLNVAFFLVFLFFAGSFFGFYELTLPESWSNRASQAEGTGGTAGIFFMALTLALVSFSCTGPILGSLLVESVSGGAWPLTAGMAGFGVALGLPFALFAAFPGFLNSMPKSGGWLNSVKVVLGFVEVALAFKFLSNADLVGEWGLLKIEPFLLIWILCAAGAAAYLFKVISFPLDSAKRKVSTIGAVAGGSFLALAVYLTFGLTTTPETDTYRTRTLLSGIAPPVCYNFFAGCDEGKNLLPFKSLEEGLTYAREVDKPVMIDFTGYTCVNCRKMEENVWPEAEIQRYLNDEYVVVSLYTDDRSELPATEHREVTRLDGSGRTKLIDQVGEKWHYFQQTVFQRSSQPYYVLVSPDGKTLNAPVAYTPDVEEYANFLACGLSTYREVSK